MDVNDHVPQFSQSVYLVEVLEGTSSRGRDEGGLDRQLGQVRATDGDGTLAFSEVSCGCACSGLHLHGCPQYIQCIQCQLSASSYNTVWVGLQLQGMHGSHTMSHKKIELLLPVPDNGRYLSGFGYIVCNHWSCVQLWGMLHRCL